MKIKRSLALFLYSILLFTGCSHESRQEVSKTFFAMDTVMNFSVYGDEKILDQTETIISDLESQMSVTDSGSQIAALNKNGSVTLTGDTRTLVQKALSLCERTNALWICLFIRLSAPGDSQPVNIRYRMITR